MGREVAGMINVTDGDFAAALRAAVDGLSREKLAEALEAESERVEVLLEELAEDSSQEKAMEGWDLYLCSLQLLEHYLHSDELTPDRLERICAQAEPGRTDDIHINNIRQIPDVGSDEIIFVHIGRMESSFIGNPKDGTIGVFKEFIGHCSGASAREDLQATLRL